MPPEKYFIRKVTIHPPEADSIADGIHGFLTKLTDEYLTLKSEFEKGTSDWFGHRKEKFVEQAQPRIPKLATFVEYLRSHERYYRSMTVEKTEQYLNPEWEEYQKTNKSQIMSHGRNYAAISPLFLHFIVDHYGDYRLGSLYRWFSLDAKAATIVYHPSRLVSRILYYFLCMLDIVFGFLWYSYHSNR